MIGSASRAVTGGSGYSLMSPTTATGVLAAQLFGDNGEWSMVSWPTSVRRIVGMRSPRTSKPCPEWISFELGAVALAYTVMSWPLALSARSRRATVVSSGLNRFCSARLIWL